MEDTTGGVPSSPQQLLPGSDGQCDMCLGIHGEHGFRLLQCQRCHLRVHEECYGYFVEHDNKEEENGNDDDDKSSNNNKSSSFWFTCWACAAVGTIVKFRERDPTTGERLEYFVTERPTECCLCHVDHGMEVPHAMHPIFDDYGKQARQIRLPAGPKPFLSGGGATTSAVAAASQQPPPQRRPSKTFLPERPAWAHTLCAMFLTSPKAGSFLFGCCKDGSYGDEANNDDTDEEDEDDDDDDDDDKPEKTREEKDKQRLVWDTESINSVFEEDHDKNKNDDDDDDDDKDEDDTLHHFAIFNEKWYGSDHAIIKKVKERQRDLKCILCGCGGGGGAGSVAAVSPSLLLYRIPLQCHANDDDEWERGQGTHVDLAGNTCYQAMHVGCAFYGPGGQDPQGRRVHFFPGNDDGDPVMALYCNVHAKDLYQDEDDHGRDDTFVPGAGDNPYADDDDDDDDYVVDDDVGDSNRDPTKKRKYQHLNNNSRRKLEQSMLNRNRSVEMSSSGLQVRASGGGGGGGGGHSKSFGRSSSSSMAAPLHQAAAFKKQNLLRRQEQQQRDAMMMNARGRMMGRPRLWNRKKRKQWQQSWKARPPSAAVMAAVRVPPAASAAATVAAAAAACANSRTSSMESLPQHSKYQGTAKKLRAEIMTELVDLLKTEEDAEARARITKVVQAKWRRLVDDSVMSAESFKKNFERARIIAMRGIETGGTRTLYKRDVPNKNVNVDLVLKDLDSIQKGKAKSMIQRLSNYLRRLEQFNETTVKECSKKTRNEVRRLHSSMPDDEFKTLWTAAKRVVGQLFNTHQLPSSKTTGDAAASKKKPPPQSNASGEETLNEKDDNDGTAGPMELENDDPFPPTITGDTSTKMEEAYRKAIQKIKHIITTQRHLPLQSILDVEKEEWYDEAADGNVSSSSSSLLQLLSQDEMDLVWKRVVKQSHKMYQQFIAAPPQPMDWSFMVVGSTFDFTKTNEYLSNWDIFRGDDEEVEEDYDDGSDLV
ncbi:hypothetical protein ACA910_009628 [Epithemia clementina (nom. ined.)]